MHRPEEKEKEVRTAAASASVSKSVDSVSSACVATTEKEKANVKVVSASVAATPAAVTRTAKTSKNELLAWAPPEDTDTDYIEMKRCAHVVVQNNNNFGVRSATAYYPKSMQGSAVKVRAHQPQQNTHTHNFVECIPLSTQDLFFLETPSPLCLCPMTNHEGICLTRSRLPADGGLRESVSLASYLMQAHSLAGSCSP